MSNPTTKKSSKNVKAKCRAETVACAKAIHGASGDNEPAITGLLDTRTAKCKSDVFACKILSSENSLVKAAQDELTGKIKLIMNQMKTR